MESGSDDQTDDAREAPMRSAKALTSDKMAELSGLAALGEDRITTSAYRGLQGMRERF